jgi:nitrite reductase (NADH) large subunit
MVGHKLVDLIARRDGADAWELTVVGEERRPAYDRVHLSRLFDGSEPDDLTLGRDAYLAGGPVQELVAETVTSIDRDRRTATTSGGRMFEWDVCVLATGSAPFVPDVPGRSLPGCFVYRTIDDVKAIKEWATGRRHGVVVGGGLLGLEAADALRRCGLVAEIVEYAEWLMPSQVDAGGGDLLNELVERLGFAVHTSTSVACVESGDDGAVAAVSLAVRGDEDAAPLATEMVVFAAGIRPRDELARQCGLDVAPRGGIVVDEQCRTSDPAIFAVGECASYEGRVYGLVAPGYDMARAAADAIVGDGRSVFAGGDTPTKLKLLGVDVATFGDAHGRQPGSSSIVFTDRLSGVHKRLVVDGSGRITGGVLIGDCRGFEVMASMAAGELASPESPAELLAPGLSGSQESPALSGVVALPPTTTVCSCENVAKAAIVDAIGSGLDRSEPVDVGLIKSATRAGTGCGGCVPQLTELLRSELEQRGVEVSRNLCAHFPQSRQELFDLIRVEGITTFSEVLARHGRGRLGCEVCRPTVASILASLTDRYVLDGEDAALQDTNDHFLANIQKDGTYSVVPRAPGGEITPEKLIVLGQVAKEFRLYVKITGGQRIDLLGARVDDLPAIWARLIDHGFESGHAYGKALRTVKSCVGSTWCRYGVQDSTSLAVDLELRYRGLRSPHKIKMAVSGCVRECAEARGKDVGVIATERGWNLYVCGNGGSRPRHADLLAEDLSTDELIRLTDRFLMYYIRTADRLQRTSVWLENIEGGIDHVRQAVVDDSLGLADDLEAAMATHVARYRCEWAETLANPAYLSRFRSFVNTDQPDPDIVVVEERAQPRPAQEWERVELLAGRP